MLILTGVLLVLGFVVLGSTFVELQAVQEKTSRDQRSSLMAQTDGIVKDFSKVVAESVLLGEANIADFKAQTVLDQERMVHASGRSGLYVEVRLDDSASQSWILDKCGGYRAQSSKDGVIIGYEKTTFTEGIMGAVYNIHVTDGQQSVRLQQYVKVYDCMDRFARTYTDAETVTYGLLTDVAASKDGQDGRAAMTLTEQLTGVAYDTKWPQANAASVAASVGWVLPAGIVTDSAGKATHPPAVTADQLVWNFDLPKEWDSKYVAVDFDVRVDAQQDEDDEDDELWLNATYEYPSGTFYYQEWEIEIDDEGEETIIVDTTPSPMGNGHWTHAEANNTTFTIYRKEINGVDMDQTYHVDYVNATAQFGKPKGHGMDVRFEWPTIPTIYGEHEINMTYRLHHTGAAESFRLDGWDKNLNGGKGDWVAIYTLTATPAAPGDWVEIPTQVLAANLYNDNRPLFRIVDLTDDDLDPLDKDTLEIDFFQMTSKADPTA